MGRAGSGRSGGSRSSGSRSRSRSSGSHRVSSSRAGSSSRRSYSGGGFSSNHHYGGSSSHHHHHHTYYHGSGGSYVGDASVLKKVFAIVVFLYLLSFVVPLIWQAFSGPSSTIVREKLDTSYGYVNNCIVDELGWFDNESKTEAALKSFYEETGIQPYIVLLAYDPSLANSVAKEEYAVDYFDSHQLNENGFLFMYFAEQDTDNDVGLMTYVNGYQASSVMDSEAVDIFWNYIDSYWYSDMSTDDLFVKVFDKTANTIMHVSTTGSDIVFMLIMLVIVVAVCVSIITIIRLIHNRKKEEAEETAKILSQPLEKLSEDDDLVDKYNT